MRSRTGFVALFDGWTNSLFVAGVIALSVARAAGYRKGRTGWLLFAASLAAYFGANLLAYLHYENMPVVPYPSWSDAGCTGWRRPAWCSRSPRAC